MRLKIQFAAMAGIAALLLILGSGCASSSSEIQQRPTTSYMQSKVGTPEELSPLAPVGASKVRKVGGQWLCEVNGQTMVYNGTRWVPQGK